MKFVQASVLVATLFCLMPACGESAQPHGHSHGESEPGTVAVTHWTDLTELFMEYPVLVAGQSGRSAIHLTDLADFSPLTAGQAIVTLRGEGGQVLEFRGGSSRPGVFGVLLQVDRAGVYDMTLRVDTPSLQDLHELGPVTVYADAAAIPADATGAPETISFLKEQQWILEFGTTEVVERGLSRGVDVPATIQPRPGGEALLTAPVPGRVDPSTRVPVPGARVQAGAVLVRIAPRSGDLRDAPGLRAALVDAEQSHALALKDRDRAARLVAARALPARRLDEAEAVLIASKARLDAAQERLGRFGALSGTADGDAGVAMLALHAPFDGVVSEVRFTAGGSVEQNDLLLRLIDPDRVHVVGAVSESMVSTVGTVVAGELQIDGQPPVGLGEPFAVNPVIDPIARTSAIRFALDNRDSRLRIGQAVRLRLFLGGEESGTAIPESAVVDDGGRPVVFVQSGGESFERRSVQLGIRANGYVHVVEGLENGERIVHRGAYLVRLAAMSTQIPSHGHVH
jgi:cobalt-zinc-cadmium efflux system membrane fusion protein